MRTSALSMALLLAWGAGPGARLGGAEVPARQKLAVLELHDSAALGDAAARFLTEQVRGTALALPAERWLIITRENLLALLPPGTDLADCVAECEVETGRNIGADVIVTGEITRVDGQLRAALSGHRVDTGQLVAQQTVAAADLVALEPALAAASARLLRALAGGPTSTAAQEPATLTVTGPAEMQIHLDGIELGDLPLLGRRVPPGPHTLVAEGRCHARVETEVTLAPGEDLNLELAPPQRRSRVTFTVRGPDGAPAQAEVFADGVWAGRAPGPVDLWVCAEALRFDGEAGEARATLRQDDLEPAVPEAAAPFEVQLRPRPAPGGEAQSTGALALMSLTVLAGSAALAFGLVMLAIGATDEEHDRSGLMLAGGGLTIGGVAGVVVPMALGGADRAETRGPGPALPGAPAWTPGLGFRLRF